MVSAQSGEIALALFDQYDGKFDALFTDIGMPDMSGWELVTEISKRSQTMPIAIISGWADAISLETKNAVKADWVVAKPFDIDKSARWRRKSRNAKQRCEGLGADAEIVALKLEIKTATSQP